jgi:hypothetical protein
MKKTVLPSYLLREGDKIQFCTCSEKPVKLKIKDQHIQRKENKCFFFFFFYYLIFFFFKSIIYRILKQYE